MQRQSAKSRLRARARVVRVGQMKSPGPPDDSRRGLAVPTTFRGVASLARAPGRWLFCWHAATAAVSAAIIVWALDATWGRALVHAAGSLPDDAAIRNGTLDWRAPAPALLHQGSSLGIVVDPEGRRDTGLSADVTLSLESRGFTVQSLLGRIEGFYPRGADIPASGGVHEVERSEGDGADGGARAAGRDRGV